MSKTLLKLKPSRANRYRVEDFLPFDDEAFVEAAYAGLLRRTPDPGGSEHFVGRLRAGATKFEILRDIRNSPEGRLNGARVAGLDFRVWIFERSRRRVRGAPFRLLFRRLLLPNTHAYCRVSDFSDLYDVDFIKAAYQTILRRGVDPTGYEYFLDRLRNGTEKPMILGYLRYSSEGRNVGVIVDGLAPRWALLKAMDWPLVGMLLRPVVAFFRLPAIQREQRILENYVMGALITGRLKAKSSEAGGLSGGALENLSQRTVGVLVDLHRAIRKK